MPIDPLIGSALIGAGVSGLQTLANGFFSQRAAAYNQEQVEKNTAANYMYSQMAQRNAALNEVRGLRAAGLSPVLANGAAGASVSAGSAGTAQAPQLNLDLSNALLLSQAKLAEAQADKTAAEADNIKQKTGEAKTAGNTAALNLYNYFSNLAEGTEDPNRKAFYTSMAEEARDAKDYGSGALVSFREFNQFYSESFEARERALAAQLRSKADELMLKDSEVAKAISRMPVAEYKKLVADMSKLVADRDNALALRKLYDSQKELTDADKKRIEEITQQIKDNNIVQAMESGDSGKTVAILLGWIFQAIGGLPGHMSASQSSK